MKRILSFLLLLVLLSPGAWGGDKKGAIASARTALVLKKDGSLWSFGANDFGTLGTGTKTCSS